MKKLSKADIGDHILALVLALVLWFFVKSAQAPARAVDTNTRRFSAIALELRNRHTDLDLAQTTSGSVALTVRGPQDLLERLSPQDLVAYIDLRTLREGTHQLSVRVDVPAGIEVTSALPSRVEITLEQIITTSVPVSLSLSGSPAPGYFTPPGSVVPESVVVTGGRTAVGNLAPFVLLIDVTDLSSSLVSSAQLQPHSLAGQALSNVSVNPSTVQYRQPVYPTRSIPIKAVAKGALGPQIREVKFELSLAQVTIAAPTETLYDVNELIIPVNVEGLTAESVVEVVPVVPPGVFLVAPPTVGVRIIPISGP